MFHQVNPFNATGPAKTVPCTPRGTVPNRVALTPAAARTLVSRLVLIIAPIEIPVVGIGVGVTTTDADTTTFAVAEILPPVPVHVSV